MNQTLPVRYSPSGPIIADVGGGMRIRLEEVNAVNTGTGNIPSTAGTICSDGFNGSAPVICELDGPAVDKQYRAEIRCDLFNVTSSHSSIVAVSLQTSVDDGVTWDTRVRSAFYIQPNLGVGSEDNGQARTAIVRLPLTSGADLDVEATTENLKVRAQVQLSMTPSGAAVGDVELASPATSGGFTELAGNIHLELEECL